MKKYFIVYLNKTYGAWARDGYEWAKTHGFKNADHDVIISETVFWIYMEKGIIGDSPVYFVKDILTKH